MNRFNTDVLHVVIQISALQTLCNVKNAAIHLRVFLMMNPASSVAILLLVEGGMLTVFYKKLKEIIHMIKNAF